MLSFCLTNQLHINSCFSYRQRIEGLLIKEEFKTNVEYIRPSIDSVIEAAKGEFQSVADICR